MVTSQNTKKKENITNRNVNKFSNILRSEFDGILVGSNTVRLIIVYLLAENKF